MRAGEVIGCYTPSGYANRHTIELGRMPRDVDPRTTVAEWVAWWRTGKDPAAEHLAEQCTQQLQARLAATPGQIPQFDELCRARLDELEREGTLTPHVAARLRAEMERTAPNIESYAYYSPGFGPCVWDDSLARHSTAAEYNSYLEALEEIRNEADGLTTYGGEDDR